MSALLTFEYSSVHGGLAAAYTSGALAAEFGPERVRVALVAEPEIRPSCDPLISELPLTQAVRRRYDTRLLGLVPDGDGYASALVTSHARLEHCSDLITRALLAILQARPHRKPSLHTYVDSPEWVCDKPLKAALIMSIDDFTAGATTLAA